MKKSLVIGLMVLGFGFATVSESRAGVIVGGFTGSKDKTYKIAFGAFAIGLGIWTGADNGIGGGWITGGALIALPNFQGKIQDGLVAKYDLKPSEAEALAEEIQKLLDNPLEAQAVVDAEGKSGVYVRVPVETTTQYLRTPTYSRAKINQIAEDLSK